MSEQVATQSTQKSQIQIADLWHILCTDPSGYPRPSQKMMWQRFGVIEKQNAVALKESISPACLHSVPTHIPIVLYLTYMIYDISRTIIYDIYGIWYMMCWYIPNCQPTFHDFISKRLSLSWASLRLHALLWYELPVTLWLMWGKFQLQSLVGLFLFQKETLKMVKGIAIG